MSKPRNDLAVLKDEILAYLGSHNFTVFHGEPRTADKGIRRIAWDAEQYPDFRQFLEVARQAEVKIVHLAHQPLSEEVIEAVADDIEATGLPEEEQDELRERLDHARPFTGFLCVVELSFDHGDRVYTLTVHPPWFSEFLAVAREVTNALGAFDDDDEDDGDTMEPMGYYSKN